MNEVVIQSFFPYSMEFFVKDGIITMPSVTKKPKNIIVMTKEHADELAENITFKGLIEQKLYRYLDKVPSSYYDSMEQVSMANQKLAETRAEAEQAKADALASKKEAEKLKAQIEELGGVTAETDAKVLDAQAERDKAVKEAEEANAEIAELKRQLAAKKPKADKE
jgi:septal ring factor EnvC (AmiA/AmiB activator)